MKVKKQFALLLAIGFSITLLLGSVVPGYAVERPDHIVQTGGEADTPDVPADESIDSKA